MPSYRAYVVDKDDKIMSRHDLEAEDHAALKAAAEKYVIEDHDVEVWLRTHIIGRVKSPR